MVYRYSSLSKYEQCPAAYHFMILDAPTVDAAIMQAGSKAHEVFEAYAQHCLGHGIETDIEAMPDIAAGLGVLPGSPLYVALIAPWLEQGHLFDANKIIGIEERMAIDAAGDAVLADDENVWLRGMLDVIEAGDESDSLVIRDYKTGFSTDANALQMEIYSLLALAQYRHIERVTCEFDYTRFNIQKRTTISRDSMPDILAHIRAIAAAIEADAEFAARPGEHCLTCQWRHECHYAPKCATQVASADDARVAIEAISLLQRDLENQKDMLKAYCMQFGPVAHNGAVWGIHGQGEDGFDDAMSFSTACNEAGVAPWEYLSVNNTKARKLRKRGVWPAPLASILVNRRSTVFRAKKEKGE